MEQSAIPGSCMCARCAPGFRSAPSGLHVLQLTGLSPRSKTAKAVVYPDRPDVHVLTDIVAARHRDGRCRERNIGVTHEQVVVFDGDRPVRRKAEFYPGACHTAPPGVARLIVHDTGCGEEGGVFVVGDGGTALYIQQNIVPGVADLAGEKADGIDLGLVGGGNDSRQAPIRSLQVSPVTLGFDPEHPAGGLPAITELSANEAPGRVVTALRVRNKRYPRIA